jgi:hypothetical protein
VVDPSIVNRTLRRLEKLKDTVVIIEKDDQNQEAASEPPSQEVDELLGTVVQLRARRTITETRRSQQVGIKKLRHRKTTSRELSTKSAEPIIESIETPTVTLPSTTLRQDTSSFTSVEATASDRTRSATFRTNSLPTSLVSQEGATTDRSSSESIPASPRATVTAFALVRPAFHFASLPQSRPSWQNNPVPFVLPLTTTTPCTLVIPSNSTEAASHSVEAHLPHQAIVGMPDQRQQGESLKTDSQSAVFSLAQM